MARDTLFHENLHRAHKIATSSDRAFGVTFAVVFGIVGCWPLPSGGETRWWAICIALAFLICALTRPSVLGPLNRLWFRFGLLLHRIMNPVLMGLIFFFGVLPTGLVMRLLGKDLLSMKWDPEAKSYWVKRDPDRPLPESLKNQF